jgi:uncharacterized membrane protein YGL010W
VIRGLVAAAVVLLVAMAAILLLADSTVATAVAFALGGTAGVLLISAVFAAVGHGEDRDRANA